MEKKKKEKQRGKWYDMKKKMEEHLCLCKCIFDVSLTSGKSIDFPTELLRSCNGFEVQECAMCFSFDPSFYPFALFFLSVALASFLPSSHPSIFLISPLPLLNSSLSLLLRLRGDASLYLRFSDIWCTSSFLKLPGNRGNGNTTDKTEIRKKK